MQWMQTVVLRPKRPLILVSYCPTPAPTPTSSTSLNMDLLGYLTRSREVQRLLARYERAEWPRVVKAVLLYGYYVLRAQKDEGLSVSELEAKVRKSGRCIQVEDQLLPTLKQQLQDVKSEIQHMNQSLATPIPPASALPNPPIQPQATAQPIEPPTKPISNDEFRKGFPASKQPGKRTLMFRDTSPPALRPGLAFASRSCTPGGWLGITARCRSCR